MDVFTPPYQNRYMNIRGRIRAPVAANLSATGLKVVTDILSFLFFFLWITY